MATKGRGSTEEQAMKKVVHEDLGYVDLFTDDQDAHRIGDIVEVTLRVRIDGVKTGKHFSTKKKFVLDGTIIGVGE